MNKKFKRKNPIIIPTPPLHPFIVNRTGANEEQEILEEKIRTKKWGRKQ